MKNRVKIDIAILIFVIVSASVLFWSLRLYPNSLFTDDIMDFLGVLLILKGMYLRMAARGFKKAYSKSGHGLVTTGPYRLVRNPMYLGTFLIGSGFVLIAWPWWSVVLFGLAFYLRFKRQITKEETYLKEIFGLDYEAYAKRTPRLFPRPAELIRVRLKESFPFEQAWATKEKGGLLGWPLLAILTEGLQQRLIFGFTDWGKIIYIVLAAMVVFAVTLWVEYRRA